jgi:hypothetical protein
VTGFDWALLGADADRLAHFIGNRAALEVKTAADGGVTFFCGVYARRPEICRVLERGSSECLADLETKSADVAKQTRIPANRLT